MTPRPNRQIDVHVGSRVGLRRRLLGMSQAKLGEALGLTRQQVQQYERGASRIGAGRLYQFSQVLDVPVSFFFDDLPAEISSRSPNSSKAEEGIAAHVWQEGEMLELVRAFYRIHDRDLRNQVRSLLNSFAEASPRENG